MSVFKQELISKLVQEHSIKNTMNLVRLIGVDQKKFDSLMDLVLNGESKVSQRAAWVMGHAAEEHPELINQWIEPMLHHLSNEVHDAIKRNTIRVLQEYPIHEDLCGLAFDACMRLLVNPNEAIAVRAFAMQVLYNIAVRFPELKHELAEAIISQMESESPGLKNRGGKILKKLGW